MSSEQPGMVDSSPFTYLSLQSHIYQSDSLLSPHLLRAPSAPCGGTWGGRRRAKSSGPRRSIGADVGFQLSWRRGPCFSSSCPVNNHHSLIILPVVNPIKLFFPVYIKSKCLSEKSMCLLLIYLKLVLFPRHWISVTMASGRWERRMLVHLKNSTLDFFLYSAIL